MIKKMNLVVKIDQVIVEIIKVKHQTFLRHPVVTLKDCKQL